LVELQPTQKNVLVLQLSDTITHIAKSPDHQIDIYQDELVTRHKDMWYVETWKRGYHYEINPHITDVHSIEYETVNYKSSQDHSKWAACNEHVWIGDLNRMTTQMKRGGGGVLIHNKKLAELLTSLVK
jgi:hypothetical protein